jgi:hypothetical protein
VSQAITDPQNSSIVGTKVMHVHLTNKHLFGRLAASHLNYADRTGGIFQLFETHLDSE